MQLKRTPFLVLMSSLAFTVVGAGFAATAARSREITSFEAAVAHSTARIESRMQVFIALLQGTASLFAQAHVTRQEFADYVRRLRLDRDYIGAAGIGYAPLVTRENREQLVAAARADGLSDFEFWPANADPYMGIFYLEPFNAVNRVAFGFDMTADPVRRAAIFRARDTGEPALSGRVALKQSPEVPSAFILYVPLYRGDEFVGVVYGAFNMADFMSGIFAPEKDPRLAFDVYDDQLMYESLFGYPGVARLSTHRTLALAGHTWTIRYFALPAFLPAIERAVAPTVAIIGVIVSLLLFSLTLAQMRSAEARDRAMQELERSNLDLDQFAYVASHDLKAPLRGIASLSQFLEDDLKDILPPDSKHHLELMRGRVYRLEALIDGILHYSRANRQPMRAEDVDVARLVEETAALLNANVTVVAPLPVLRTAQTALQQVFLNLIRNAQKYGGGSAEVSARDVGPLWEFCVADQGPGIAPQFHNKIWGIFQTLNARDDVEGTGIGLAVVRKIVDFHGGSAWVDSAEGSGARFYFTWPK